MMESIYNFEIDRFDIEGYNLNDGTDLFDLITLWENDFHEKFKPFIANYLFSNHATMILFNHIFVADGQKLLCGMDLIDGEINHEIYDMIEEHSEYGTIYAIGSSIKEFSDEPLFSIIDDRMPRGQVILKYVPDEDDDDDEINSPIEPIHKTKKVNV